VVLDQEAGSGGKMTAPIDWDHENFQRIPFVDDYADQGEFTAYAQDDEGKWWNVTQRVLYNSASKEDGHDDKDKVWGIKGATRAHMTGKLEAAISLMKLAAAADMGFGPDNANSGTLQVRPLGWVFIWGNRYVYMVVPMELWEDVAV
jgi:hypothetical protein